jgi:hypothetical protein
MPAGNRNDYEAAALSSLAGRRAYHRAGQSRDGGGTPSRGGGGKPQQYGSHSIRQETPYKTCSYRMNRTSIGVVLG